MYGKTHRIIFGTFHKPWNESIFFSGGPLKHCEVPFELFFAISDLNIHQMQIWTRRG